MYGKNHYNIVISLQLIKINGKKKEPQQINGKLNLYCNNRKQSALEVCVFSRNLLNVVA